MSRAESHPIKARKVNFDLSNSPAHWLPDDVFSSHLVNGINLLLPAGELWFCRVYNKALPHVTDPQLKEDVIGFIRQEGIHAQAHRRGEAWLRDQGYDVDKFRRRIDWLFEILLGEKPLGLSFLKNTLLEKQWLVLRVGIIAAIEHFTGLLGDWCMNSDSWDKGDPVVADLFRWHLAEEVEHRTVAFDLYEHMCQSKPGFYLSRQAVMALVFPIFVYVITEGGRSLAGQDSDPAGQKIAQQNLLRQLIQIERTGRRNGNVPTVSFVLERTLRWVSPWFHPISEGDTEQALAYIARSPAATAGASAS
ncbi:MAG: metal-dependent hydrolase [Alcanivoracaceae bacterium]|nr:metal-dependent hydrolase [Alcanivoracaceae bacterium]